MLTAWTNFAKYSDPNGNGEGEGLGWQPCTAENPQFMLFKLDGKDAEASEMGEPIIPEPMPMPNMPMPANMPK
jgi:para-nitrobenzyl esterase